MPIHVEEMSTEVATTQGDLPLSQEQLDMLVEYVAKCLEQKQMEAKQRQDSTQIRGSVMTDW